MSKAELAVSYAALILHEGKSDITADKLNAILKAANITVPPFWTNLYAKVFSERNIGDLITNVGGSSAPAPAPVAAVKEEAKKEKKEEKKEEKKKEEKKEEPEEDEDMGFGLFD